MNGKNWEELIDRPDIWQRLEDRQIAEVCVTGRVLEVFKFLGNRRHFACLVANLRACRPEQSLDDRAMLKREIAHREQIHRFIARLQRIVIALEQATFRDCVVGFEEVDDGTWYFAIRERDSFE